MGKRTNTAKWDEKTKRWKINVQKDGRRRSFYSSTPGRNGQREANRKADEWLDEGIDGTNERVSTLYEQYVDTLKLSTSKSNWKGIADRGKNYIIPAIGDLKISDVTEGQLQKIIQTAYKKQLSKKTLMNLRATIVSFIKYCRINKYTQMVPESLSIPKGARIKKKRILQPDDLVKLFTSDMTLYRGKVQRDDFINAYRFAVLTGLRPGEIKGLKWDDIHGDLVSINRSINIYGETTDGKNEDAIRTFALTPLAKSVIDDQRKYRDTEYIFDIGSTCGYYKRWQKYCSHNGMTVTSLYEIRHTFVSVVKELPEGKLKALVGHSENMDTIGTYGHEISGEMEDTANMLQEIFEKILHQKS